MAKSSAVAGAVVVVANIVGLAAIATGDRRACTDATPRSAGPDAVAGGDADRLAIGRKGFRRVDSRWTRKLERTGPQPAAGGARHAIPSGNRFGFRFWSKATRIAHRGRPCARAAAPVMLSSNT